MPKAQKYAGKGQGDPLQIWLKNMGAATFPVTSDILLPADFEVIPWDTLIEGTTVPEAWDPATPERVYCPTWARWVRMWAHVTFAKQTTPGATLGQCRIHLFRDDLPTPPDDAAYHAIETVQVPPVAGLSTWGNSFQAQVPNWIPILNVGEYWTVPVWQNTGQSLDVLLQHETHFCVEFR